MSSHELLKLPPHPDETPFVAGYAMTFGLMGVLCAQCFIYFSRFPEDRLWTRLVVAVVFLLESLITAFALHGFYIGVITHDVSDIVVSGNGGKHLTPTPLWSFVAMAPLTGAVSTLTHAFFCWRIWAVRKLLAVPILVMMVSLLQSAMISYGGIVFGLVPDTSCHDPIPFYIPVWLSGSLFCDLMITVYMTDFLLRTKSRYRNTWSMSKKLIKLTIETGLVTTTAAAVELVFAIAFRVTLFHIALFYIISKLYANCLLATLNARLILRSPKSHNKSVAVWEYTASDAPMRSMAHSGLSVSRTMPVNIEVHTEVETAVEIDSSPRDDYVKSMLSISESV